VNGQIHIPAALSLKVIPNPLNKWVGVFQSRSERFGEEKNLLPLRGFEPRTAQLVP
jgi:hypothetical protein